MPKMCWLDILVTVNKHLLIYQQTYILHLKKGSLQLSNIGHNLLEELSPPTYIYHPSMTRDGASQSSAVYSTNEVFLDKVFQMPIINAFADLWKICKSGKSEYKWMHLNIFYFRLLYERGTKKTVKCMPLEIEKNKMGLIYSRQIDFALQVHLAVKSL